jgi:hypothetical protein
MTQVSAVESQIQSDKRVKNGVYTMVSHKSGEHRTFRIATVQNERSGLHGKRIVSLLSGPDNQSDYIGFAFLNDDNSLSVWGRFRQTLTHEMGRCLMRFLVDGVVADDGSVRIEGVNGHVLFQSACCVCNRPLTCPESIRTGIGPVCAGR